MIKVLNFIKNEFEKLKIPYSFGEWSDEKVPNPFFTGEMTEVPQTTEDGYKESTFILNGFGRCSLLEFEKVRAKIEKHFNPVTGLRTTFDDGSGVVIFYENTLVIPLEEMEFKRIQINLTIKEWRQI